MKKMHAMKFGIYGLLFAAAALAAGCARTAANPAPAAADAAHAQNAAQLWADNCNRCHNVRSPNMYSDAQWEVITLHMRVRANLVPAEYREILAFLKASH